MGPLVFGVAKTEHIVQGKPFTDYFVGLEWKAGMVFASLLRRQPGMTTIQASHHNGSTTTHLEYMPYQTIEPKRQLEWLSRNYHMTIQLQRCF